MKTDSILPQAINERVTANDGPQSKHQKDVGSIRRHSREQYHHNNNRD